MKKSSYAALLCSAVVVLATIAAAGPASAQNFRKAPGKNATALTLDPTQATQGRSATKVYVVQMAAKPGIGYQGGVSGFAKTAPAAGARYDSRSSQAQMYAQHLESEQDSVLASIGAGNRKIYSYRHALNGFAARLTAAEAAKLRKNKSVLRVWEDRAIPVDTNNSPRFLGLLNEENGLRTKHHLTGENVVIGMIDTGAVQEHPSFDGTGYKPPKNWNGTCQAGEGWSANDCNNKLIGARWFADGFLAASEMVDGEFLSARDSDGHGTHTASTAAGNSNVTASLAGTPLTKISGIAPRARLAIYKACWQAPGAPSSSCFFSDSAAAADAAVADGVDVINFSVGSAFAFNDPVDIAFLNAAAAGVFVAQAAGNEGPGPETTAAGEPWVTSVAASTQNGTAFALAAKINSPAAIAGNYPALEGAITKPLAESGPVTGDLVAADPIEACTPIASVGGKIVLIARGTCSFVAKVEAAVNAGASAVLMYTNANPKVVMGVDPTALTQTIPGVMIDNAPGLAILAQLTGGTTVNASLAAGIFIREKMVGNVMADFSSRGPFPTEPDWVKPDVTAPGVRILAGATPEPNDGSIGDFFQYLNGTSMATPHVAGLAALVRQRHRSWSPAMIKSALMTTARRNVVKEDGVTPADPFDFGAGHVNPNYAINPGLVYDAGLFDYLAASCGTVTPLVSEPDCSYLEGLGYSLDPADLNLPSIGIGKLAGSQTIRRTVTNVSTHSGSYYEASVTAPEGFKVTVSPRTLYLHPGESAAFEVTITNKSAPPGEWRFGRLVWADNHGHHVRSPIAVNAVALVAPEEITGTGTPGATSFDVTFGYTGAYSNGKHGLVDPFLTLDTVEDDPGNSFQFFGPGTTLAYVMDLPVGTVYAQWSLFNEYVDGNHDLDLYLFYCPDFVCTQIASSGNTGSNERVSVSFPVTDPTIDDPYVVFVHGYNTAGGAPAQFILFDWTDPNVGPDAGNMTVSGPSSATLGQTATIDVSWAGLSTGAGAKQVGAISHNDGTGIKALTIVNITNDVGEGFCSFGLCGP